MTSSILTFSDDATTQKHVFKVAFFCICSMLLTKTSYFYLSKDGIICYFNTLHYLVNLIFVRNVLQTNFKKKVKM